MITPIGTLVMTPHGEGVVEKYEVLPRSNDVFFTEYEPYGYDYRLIVRLGNGNPWYKMMDSSIYCVCEEEVEVLS